MLLGLGSSCGPERSYSPFEHKYICLDLSTSILVFREAADHAFVCSVGLFFH